MLAGVIPRRVHLYWADPTGGSAPLPDDVAVNVERWSVHHPDYEVHVWTLPELADLLRDFHGVAVLDAIEACRFPSTQSNMVRLALLYEYGGFYSDLKNRPLRPFLDELIDHEAAVVTEHPPTIPDHEGKLMNAFLGSGSGHELWMQALWRAVRNVEQRLPLTSIRLTGIGNLENAMGRRMLRTVFDDVSRAAQHSTPQGIELSWPIDFVVIPSRVAWGSKGQRDGWMRRTRASYNNAETPHWYERQKTESIYVDGPGVPG